MLNNENKLTTKQENFCLYVVEGKSQADAYRLAYPNNQMNENALYVQSSNLMKNPKIDLRVKELRKDLANKVLWSRERAIEELVSSLDICNKNIKLADNPNTIVPLNNTKINTIKELNKTCGIYPNEALDLNIGGQEDNPIKFNIKLWSPDNKGNE